VLRYLGRYTHRVAISNHRLISFDGENVVFRWRDYAHGNKKRKMTLTAMEFLRRLSQHILPRGFVRIRHFGFLTNVRRSGRLKLARQFLADAAQTITVWPAATTDNNHMTWHCPRCQLPMRIGENLSALQIRSRCRELNSS
jgi:hypothetical protein